MIMKNQYGLDAHYFRKKLKVVVRDVEMFTPDEMFTELSRLMMVAGTQANLKVTLSVKQIPLQ
jgi:hypothetical protein